MPDSNASDPLQASKVSLTEELYSTLAKHELQVQEAVLDERYGTDKDFTEQTKSLQEITLNLRKKLKEDANGILISNNQELKQFLEELGIHTDKIEEWRENGQVANSIGTAIEHVVKIAHPLL